MRNVTFIFLQIYDIFPPECSIFAPFTNLLQYIMKRLILLMVLCGFAVSAQAQITITYEEFLASFALSGTQSTFSSEDLSGLSALIALDGAAKTWDFTNRVWVKETSTDTVTTSFLPYPSGAALAEDADFLAASHVFKIVSSNPLTPIVYEFIKIDPTGLWTLGFSQDSMGVKAKLFAYNPPLQNMKFPLTYQTTWQSTSEFHAEGFPPGATIVEKEEAICDAYGTLMLPGTTAEALRVKTRFTQTINIFSFEVTSVTHSFQWFTKSGASAIITADTNQAPTGVSYAVPGATGRVETGTYVDELLNIRVSANPVSNTETTISYTMPATGNVEASLMDGLGREVRILQNGKVSEGAHAFTLNPADLSAGTYFLRINTGGYVSTRKLIISK
jgi:hypothetical protein